MNATICALQAPAVSSNLHTRLREADTVVPQRISARAAQAPDALALSCGDDRMTYGELDRKSSQLARHLQELGAGSEVPVGLYVERSLDYVMAALAILKSGAAYLPLDPAWPAERVAAILRDAQAPILVSHRWKPASLPPGNWTTVDLDICAPQLAAMSGTPLPASVEPSDLAYIIYTSGSTGRPKGVEITHANLLSLIAWHNAEFHVTGADRASVLAGLGFDAAVWEIWPYLVAGSSLHIASDETRRSAENIQNFLIGQKITIAFAPTAVAESLIAMAWPRRESHGHSTHLRWLLTGGDTLHRYPEPGLPFSLVNNYGPTECTVLATSGLVRSALDGCNQPSIGRPIPSAQVHILDKDLHAVTPGIPGEICIAGPGVGRGYRNLPELTDAKFAANPFGPGRLYRTGDRGRMLSNGEIAFLGRIDNQVKIRGYRIEPEEIMIALNRHAQIRSSVVIAVEGELVAYLVLEPGAALTQPALRDFLSTSLPDYMIPNAFVQLSELPVTTSGKYDRAALPVPTPANLLPFTDQPTAPEAAAGGTQSRVLNTICALVGTDAIAPEDNFFLAGGHSMLAAQLLVRIRQDFGVSLTLRQLFQAPTASALAQAIDKALAAKPSEPRTGSAK